MRIWKFPIEVIDQQILMVPKDAKFLDVQMQRETCCLWALCNQDAEKEERYLKIYGTGNPMPDDPGDYIATFQMHGGTLVFHVFESRFYDHV